MVTAQDIIDRWLTGPVCLDCLGPVEHCKCCPCCLYAMREAFEGPHDWGMDGGETLDDLEDLRVLWFGPWNDNTCGLVLR